MTSLRNNNPLLQQMNFDDDLYDNRQNVTQANWYRRDGSLKTDIDWVNHEHHCFALHIVGEIVIDNNAESQEWLLCINSLDKDRDFTLPILKSSEPWQCFLNTAQANMSTYATLPIETSFSLQARSMHLYRKTSVESAAGLAPL
jgi:glycogen operon protein